MNPDLYALVGSKAMEIEAELKRLNRWSSEQLPHDRFENMGAFGSNTMAFEQWIQFVLIPRIQEIISEGERFPESSNLATYAVRAFDGDTDVAHLSDLLYDLDNLISQQQAAVKSKKDVFVPHNSEVPPTIVYGSVIIPDVVYTLIEVLPQFSGDDLEAQLQTYDTFLSTLSPSVRPKIAAMLEGAAEKTENEVSRLRILKAAKSVVEGGRAAEPYNHEEAMKRNVEEYKKSFPDR